VFSGGAAAAERLFARTACVVIPNGVRNPEGLAEGNLILFILHF
jgi:hypothetical protein